MSSVAALGPTYPEGILGQTTKATCAKHCQVAVDDCIGRRVGGVWGAQAEALPENPEGQGGDEAGHGCAV